MKVQIGISTTNSPSSITTTSAPPVPTQSGLAPNCTKIVVAQKGDYCYAFAQNNGAKDKWLVPSRTMSADPQGDKYIIYSVGDAQALAVPEGATTSPLDLKGEPLIFNNPCTRQVWKTSIIERESRGTYWVTLTNVASGTVMETETIDDDDDDDYGEKDGIA
ncbi:MAG: hypothetical protein Q9166_006794 [cf. Caloplaca sp. 2 TL-2023]